MAASSTTGGKPKYPLRNDSDGLKIALPTSAFGPIIPLESSSIASSSGVKYDVFINHCGKDVKHTLASKIYNSLNATGLRVFLDKDELKQGDLIPTAIEEAMASASLHIAIFSEHYAQSPWCLAELAFMMETRTKIIPIFYHVEPSDLRWVDGGNGKYAKAFAEHGRKGRYTPEVLQRWKRALQVVSVRHGSIINNIDDENRAVNRVMKKMNKVALEVAKYPVGLDAAVQEFNTIAPQSAGSIQIVGIWGMGGSGKTTLAKEIFKKRCLAMDRSSFLFDLRDAAGKGLLVEKQKQLLKDLDVKDVSFDHVDVGKGILRSRLRSMSVLIVLDDVDHLDQLDALLPPKESLGERCLIIVTTRSKDVLLQWGISSIYQMRPLTATHARQLFCWHAFVLNSPPLEFKDLVEKVLDACQGLPLSLKVLGGLLYGKSNKDCYWQRTLNKFSQIPHEDITNRLKVSYDALEKQDKEMFLDVACLFIGQRKSAAIAAWDAEINWDGLLGWETLFNKCLVEEDEYGLIRMHDHLRDLGRVIANGQSPHRLWSPQQVIEIPHQQEAVRVRGMANATGDNCNQQEGKIIINTSQGERSLMLSSLGLKFFLGNGGFINHAHSAISRELVWFQCEGFGHKNVPSWFSLKNLRILELVNDGSLEYLWEHDAEAPLNLRELVIRDCSLHGFPRSIGRLENLKKILIIDPFNGNSDRFIDLPQEFCHLKSLEHLEIEGCRNMSSLPSNFGKLTNLQHLSLEGCSKLEELPNSFKKLTHLEYLSLLECSELIIKSELHVLENMSKLRYLNLEGCMKLEELRLPQVASLTELYLTDTSLKELPANISQLTELTKLQIGSKFLKTLPASFGNLPALSELEIKGCANLETLPTSFQNLSSLNKLKIYKCHNLKLLPTSFENLSSLIELEISSCENLQTLPTSSEDLSSSTRFEIKKCDNLETLPASPRNLSSLTTFTISDCEKLESLPDSLEHLNSLTDLCISDSGLKCLPKSLIRLKELRISYTPISELSFEPGCMVETVYLVSTKVSKISFRGDCCPFLERLILRDNRDLRELESLPASLKTIVVGNCDVLHDIGGVHALRNLQRLRIYECGELEGLPGSEELVSLQTFALTGSSKVKKISGLQELRSLQELTIQLDELPSLEELISLTKIKLYDCHKLEKTESWKHLKSLEELEIRRCPDLEALPNIQESTSLKKLLIADCPELDELPSLAELTSLKKFELYSCHKLQKIEGLEGLTSLETLKISACSELEMLPGLGEITSLKIIELKGCNIAEKIESLENRYDCPKLTSLRLEMCHKLKKIKGLENIRSMETLEIYDCPELYGLPSLSQLTSLKKFELQMCPKVEQIEGLENLRSLEILRICCCPELVGLPSLAELTSLKNFDLQMCPKVEQIEGLENIRSMKTLEIYDCPELYGLPSLSQLTSLKKFELQMCPKVEQIEGLENIRSMKTLEINDCPELYGLPSLSQLTSLKKFELQMCPKVEQIEGLENLRSLEILRICCCPELVGLPSLAELTSLKNFDLQMCPKVEQIEGLENLRSLEILRICGCPELVGLPSLAELTSLEKIDLQMCNKLETIEGLEQSRSLEKFEEYIRWNAPCIVGLEQLEQLEQLVVVTNDKSTVEPVIIKMQKWPREVIICTRAMCDVGQLKKNFEELPNVSVLDYERLSEESSFLRQPESFANAKVILICLIIDCVHPDLHFYINSFVFNLGKGKWVWMGVFTQASGWQDYIYTHNGKGENVKVKVEAAWLVMGEEGSIIEAFRHLWKRQKCFKICHTWIVISLL
ncbi:disease resistance protein RPV1 isoform X2 [Cryptomeria japonica]|uniref:disease resistance protein RPV1 isoform X2 n=1 Tax=Cryptomeria japonica TaxID=3369 RepID=UPI0027DA437E|nr:disease resistance protein RPV1 isoform X2 [Cryptomeria japonica]